jgi:hypothetical protein
MNLEAIPKFFWYALSVCALIATMGLVVIAWRSASVSIEIANAKISLSSAVEQTDQIKRELQAENERLRNAARELEQKVALLEKQTKLAAAGTGGKVAVPDLSDLKQVTSQVSAAPVSADRFKALDARISEVRKYSAIPGFSAGETPPKESSP